MNYITLADVKKHGWTPHAKRTFKDEFGDTGMPVDYDVILEFIRKNQWGHTWLSQLLPKEHSSAESIINSATREVAIREFCEIRGSKKSLVDKIVEQSLK